MGKSHDLATGLSYQDLTETDARYHTKTASNAAFAAKAGDTFTGAVNVNGGNLTLNSTSEASGRYLFLNTGATKDGHILFQRAGAPKFQISSDTSNNLFTWNYAKNGTSHRINTDGSVITPHQPAFRAYASTITTALGVVVFPNVNQRGATNYNTSNGRFTCPQSGWYQFHFQFLTHSPGTRHDVAYYKNGGNYYEQRNYKLSGNHETHTMSLIDYFNANDYITVNYVHHSGGIYNYTSWTSWMGHFLG